MACQLEVIPNQNVVASTEVMSPPERSKIVAIITGAISVLIAIFYLILITVLDARGPMRPPPQEALGVAATDVFSGVATVRPLVSSRSQGTVSGIVHAGLNRIGDAQPLASHHHPNLDQVRNIERSLLQQPV
tara:strand:- start:71 stop:466 length:396 start_codon:yes stop_codon:yes gene_type:complete